MVHSISKPEQRLPGSAAVSKSSKKAHSPENRISLMAVPCMRARHSGHIVYWRQQSACVTNQGFAHRGGFVVGLFGCLGSCTLDR